jgi:uncharacterized protein
VKRPPTRGKLSYNTLRSLDKTGWDEILAGAPEEAARCLEAAACYGIVEAQVLFGQVLLDGRGIGRDAPRAYRWFRIAAEANHVPAMNMVGRCLELGWGVAREWPEAARWYRRAAEASLDWAQYNLANMLLRGRGVEKDRAQALEWYLRAARQGHAKSINLVGRFLEEGWEVERDRFAAISLYRQAAELGDFRAQFNLATWLIQQGRSREAVFWLQQAATIGSVDFVRDLNDWISRFDQLRFPDVEQIVAGRLASVSAA